MTRELVGQKLKQFFSNKTIVFCLIFTILFLLAGYVKWFEIAQGIISILAFIILPVQSAFSFFLYLHCFTYSAFGARYPISFIILFAVFVIILLVKYCIGLKKNRYHFYKPIVLAISIFVIFYVLISFAYDIYFEAFCYIGYFILAYLFLAMRGEFDIRQAMKYLTASLIISCTLSLIALGLPNYDHEVLYGSSRFNAFSHHPNYLYMVALFVLTYFFYRYLTHNLKTTKFVILYVVCATIVLSTLSKTGIVLLALFSILFFVLLLRENFKKRIIIVLIILLIMTVIALICHKFVFALIDRFVVNNGDIVNSLLTGRDEIWLEYLKESVKNPLTFLFGHGLVAQEVYIPSQQMTRASHNLYLFLLYRFGLIGLLALIFIVTLFIKNLNKERPKFLASLSLIWYLIESLCDNTFKPYNFMLMILSIMILFMDTKEKSSSIKENIEDKV